MDSFFQTLAFTYLLYPILGLLLVGLGIFIAKKNALLNNKRCNRTPDTPCLAGIP